MNRALAVVSGSERAKDLVREAGELAAGVDAELVLLHVTTEEEFAEKSAALAAIPNVANTYHVDSARDGAKQYARDVGNEVLSDVDVDVTPVGSLGDEVEEVLAAAEAYDCDHVFLTGRERSPAGKALFGDIAQKVILGFDGAVTIVTDEE